MTQEKFLEKYGLQIETNTTPQLAFPSEEEKCGNLI